MTTFLATLTPDWPLAQALARALAIPPLPLAYGHYPDQESRFTVQSDIHGARIILLADLHHPDLHTLPLLLLADTLRDLGASHIHLLVPYLPYMRQDKRFNPGEGVTSRYYAALLSRHVDQLTTIDPHLHRYHSLAEIYPIPGTVLHAAPLLAKWVAESVSKPLLVGPDSESEQWVKQVAAAAGAPYVIASKHRHGDRSVTVTLPDMQHWQGHNPVLVDDIISSGKTMLEANRALLQAGLGAATCVGVHALCSEPDYQALLDNVAQLVTCDCVPHRSNGISVAPLLAQSLADQFSHN